MRSHSFRVQVLRAIAASGSRGLNVSEAQTALREREMSKVRRELHAQVRENLTERDAALRYTPTSRGIAYIREHIAVDQLTLEVTHA